MLLVVAQDYIGSSPIHPSLGRIKYGAFIRDNTSDEMQEFRIKIRWGE